MSYVYRTFFSISFFRHIYEFHNVIKCFIMQYWSHVSDYEWKHARWYINRKLLKHIGYISWQQPRDIVDEIYPIRILLRGQYQCLYSNYIECLLTNEKKIVLGNTCNTLKLLCIIPPQTDTFMSFKLLRCSFFTELQVLRDIRP